MASLPCPRVGILGQPISPVALDSVFGSCMHWRRCWLVPLHGIRSCNLEWARCDLVTSVDPLGGGCNKFYSVLFCSILFYSTLLYNIILKYITTCSTVFEYVKHISTYLRNSWAYIRTCQQISNNMQIYSKTYTYIRYRISGASTR